jgi:tetratricopeptide (TPR) repeat protein
MARHRDGQTRVIPLIWRPCDWRQAPFGGLEPLPRDGHPIQGRVDEALAQVAEEVRQLVERRATARVTVVENVAAVPPPRPDWHGIAGTGASYFVGRSAELQRIHDLLQAGHRTSSGTGLPFVQIVAFGGTGKSLLAVEYGQRFGSSYLGDIFWLNAQGNLDEQLASFAADLRVATEGLKPADIRAALSEQLRRAGKPYLWVIDDLPGNLSENEFALRLPPERNYAHVLATCLSRAYEGRGELLELEQIAETDALRLLGRLTPPKGSKEQGAARRICNELGYHALALDLASHALCTFPATGCYKAYLRRLRRRSRDELELSAKLTKRLPNGHAKSIAVTLLRSLDELGPEAWGLLRLAAELAQAPIPTSLAQAVVGDALQGSGKADSEGDADVEAALRVGLYELQSGALARLEGGDLPVHGLVARTVRFCDTGPVRRGALRRAAVRAIGVRLADSDDVRKHGALRSLVPHARHLAARTPETKLDCLLVGRLARHDWERGAFSKARALYETELEARERLLGPEHPDTLVARNNLALSLLYEGDLTNARTLQERVLEERERLLGADHPGTVTARSNLALILLNQGDLTNARTLQERVIEGRERVLSPDHPDTLSARSNLAGILRGQGDLAGARALQERVLEALERALGPEHLDTLGAASNLAVTYYQQGKLACALALEERVLEGRQRALGPAHPYTLLAMYHLAMTLRGLGNETAASALESEVQVNLSANERTRGRRASPKPPLKRKGR